VNSIVARFLLPLVSVALSLIVGAVALGLFWSHFPDTTLHLFRGAGAIREAIFAGNWPTRYEAVSRGLLDERLIVYMGFVIAARLVFGLLLLPVYRRFDRKPQSEFRI
jgi:hypothetical protein